jgi:hypothetical protein
VLVEGRLKGGKLPNGWDIFNEARQYPFQGVSQMYISEELNLEGISKDELSLEDLFLIVLLVVDHFFKGLIGSQDALRRSNNSDPLFSDQEVITIALVGELKGENSQRGWYRFVRKNHLHLFPALCSLTRYGRRLRRLKDVMSLIREQFIYQLDAKVDHYRIVDSFPLRLCHLRRLSSSTTPFEYCATVGYCEALKEYFYGFKVHLLTDLRGIPIYMVLTPAHPHDTQGLVALLEDLPKRELANLTLIVVGDKAYVGGEYARMLKETYGVDILPIERNYHKELGETGLNQMLKKTRKIIETTVSELTETMKANWTYCRTLLGLATSLVAKLTAFNLANFLNSLMGEPLLEVKGFAN